MEFYREKNTKISKELGVELPLDWKCEGLGNLAVEIYRYPTYYNIAYVEEGIPEIRGELIGEKGDLEPDKRQYRNISLKTSKRFPRTILKEGDFVLTVRGTMGKVAMVPKELDGANITANLMKISLDKKICHPPFFKQLFISEYFRKSINDKSSQTTIKTIQVPRLREINFPVPPTIKEQQQIASFLSLIDYLIQQTDDVIRKTRELKKGLMQQLLTRGIGHTEFRYSEELGCKIPEEWEVVEIGMLIDEIKNGFASGKRDERGIVQVRMNNVTTDGRLIFDSYLKVPKPSDLSEWLLKSGDFLFNNTNSIDLVGKSAIFYSAPFPCTFSNHFTRIRFNKSRILPELILYKFLILWERDYFKSVAIRHVGQSAVRSDYLKKIRIALPPLREQKNIVSILKNMNRNIEQERENKTNLETLKKGLMQILLTGQVRIKVN